MSFRLFYHRHLVSRVESLFDVILFVRLFVCLFVRSFLLTLIAGMHVCAHDDLHAKHARAKQTYISKRANLYVERSLQSCSISRARICIINSRLALKTIYL